MVPAGLGTESAVFRASAASGIHVAAETHFVSAEGFSNLVGYRHQEEGLLLSRFIELPCFLPGNIGASKDFIHTVFNIFYVFIHMAMFHFFQVIGRPLRRVV